MIWFIMHIDTLAVLYIDDYHCDIKVVFRVGFARSFTHSKRNTMFITVLRFLFCVILRHLKN